MVGEKGRHNQKNRGMNFTPDHLKRSTATSDSEGSCTPTPGCSSLNKVKNELQTVIELMGPSTPNFIQSSSNNADNEESIYSNTTSVTHEEKSALDTDPLLTECNNSTLPPDISLEEDPSRPTDSSLVVDKPSTMVDLPEYICPPPDMPTSFVFNSECMCPQIASYIQKGNVRGETIVEKPNKSKNMVKSFLRSFKEKRSSSPTKKSEYYTINIKKSHSREGIPERLVFDLVDDIPKASECPCQCDISDEKFMRCVELSENDYKTTKNLKNQYLCGKHKAIKSDHLCGKHAKGEQHNILHQDDIVSYGYKNAKGEHHINQDEIVSYGYKNMPSFHKNNENFRTSYTESNGATRVDVYYFDHGNSSYFRTTDRPPVVTTEAMAEKTEVYTTKFWAEIFGSIHIGFSFFTSFILQAVRFSLYSIIRPLTVGLIQLTSDYFFKPLLATIFNGCIQPPLIFLYNIASSIRDLCDPVAEGIGYFIRECAVLIRAFRIVDVKNERLLCQSSKSDHVSDKKSRII